LSLLALWFNIYKICREPAALFRYKVGIMPVIGACAAAGLIQSLTLAA